MAISRIGSASAQATSLTVPVHAIDDLILIAAFRDGSTTPPTLPVGYNDIQNGGDTASSMRLGWRRANATNDSSGTWTNATEIIAVVYRGDVLADPIGDSNVFGGSGTTVTYPGLTMQVTDGTSWVVGIGGHQSTNTTIETAPTNMSLVKDQAGATAEEAWHDTNTGVTSWPQTNVSVGGTSAGWFCITVEILAAATNVVVTPGTLALTLTMFAPVIQLAVIPSTLALTITTFAPTVTVNTLVTPATLALTLTTFAPTVLTPRLVTPGTLALAIAAFAPQVNLAVIPGALALTLTTFAPTVTATANVVVTPSTLALVIATFAPTITTTVLVIPSTLHLVLTMFAPTVITPVLITPGTLALILTTFAPTILIQQIFLPAPAPNSGTFVIAGAVVQHSLGIADAPASGSFTPE